ncbi:MAG: transposase [Mycobacterium sp.]
MKDREECLTVALPHGRRRTEQPRRLLVVIAVKGQARKAFQRVRHMQVPLCAGGDREGVMAIAFSLLRLALGHRDSGARVQRNHPVPAGCHRDRVVRPVTSGNKIAAGQCGLSHRGETFGEDVALGDGAPHRGLARLSPQRRVRLPTLAYFTAGRISNGPTEAVNLLIKKILRVGHGFRNFDNYRLRLLLHCGITWHHQSTTPLRGRLPRLAA